MSVAMPIYFFCSICAASRKNNPVNETILISFKIQFKIHPYRDFNFLKTSSFKKIIPSNLHQTNMINDRFDIKHDIFQYLIILQQSSMQNKGKYVSSLDLKMLGAKFMAIHDNQFQMNSNLSSIRKSKGQEFPSIFKTQHQNDDTTINSTILDSITSTKIILQAQPTTQHQIIKHKDTKNENEVEKQQINKYRNMIKRIKEDNNLIHREIINLCRDQKLCDNEPKTKIVKTILEVGRCIIGNKSAIKVIPESKQYEAIYERLSHDENPYRRQSLEIQKKFESNNLHKNFEAFLLSHNKRVPEFIKNIR